MACTLMKAAPSVKSAVVLNLAALALLQTPVQTLPYLSLSPRCDWISVDSPDAFLSDFYEIRVVIGKYLSAEEVERVAGCIGYALRQELAGEDLSDPHVIQSFRAGQTILLFGYDSTKSRRDDPDADAAFALCGRYIVEGTPVRTTNRAGAGTKGTRLVSGIGACPMEFAVR